MTTDRDLKVKRRAAAHPDRPGERCAAPKGIWVPIINQRRCEAKTDCVIVCPNDVFEVRRIDPEDFQALGPFARLRVRMHGGRMAYAPGADQCAACGLCVVACPQRAITLQRSDAG